MHPARNVRKLCGSGPRDRLRAWPWLALRPKRRALPFFAAGILLPTCAAFSGCAAMSSAPPAAVGPAASVPAGFWRSAPSLPSGYTDIFPRNVGTRVCRIRVGHPVPGTPKVAFGTCTTQVVGRAEYVSLVSSAGQIRSQSGALPKEAVILTETWPGSWFQTNVARWVFATDASGRVMGMEYLGHPPQFAK